MPWLVLVLLLLAGDAMAADLIADAASRFHALDTYRATLRSQAADGSRQVIRYAWRKPGWIRMDFVEPHHGATLIYDPTKRRVQLHPFGVDHMPTLDLAPDNALIRSPRGHTVDRSDVGELLASASELRARGNLSAPADGEVAGRPVTVVEVEGTGDAKVADVHRYRLWLARDSLFPLKVQSFGMNGELLETVELGDVELDPAFPERFFKP